jgi:hypothetical protein
MSDPSEAGSALAGQDAPSLPSFPARVGQTFFSPGELATALAARPAFGAALALGAVLVLLQGALIPAEVWEAMFRETLVQRGQEMPEGMTGGGAAIMRISAMVAGPVMYCLMTFLFAGVVTLILAFVMGDDGKYRQYLAVLAHAWIISSFVGLLLVPLRITEQNPQLTLNLGTFLFFLPEGYLRNVVNLLDLSQFWAWFVVALGAAAIDKRRSVGSALTVLIGISVVVALIFGFFVPAA